ncbi:MAG: hypothetical protein ABIU29_11810 [Chthoniobacterales bacterium]
MKARVAVILANDPDFEGGRDLGFEGRRMAYAGRSGAKFEAAAKAGAAGLVIIHEDAAASYPFSQLGSGDALPTMVVAPLNPSAIQFARWITLDVAQDLLAKTGLKLGELKTKSRDPAFRAFAMKDATLSAAGEIKATPLRATTSSPSSRARPSLTSISFMARIGTRTDRTDRTKPVTVSATARSITPPAPPKFSS